MKKPLRIQSALAIAVVSWLAAVGAPAQAQDAKPGDKLAGEHKAAMCIGCHGIPDYKASFPEVYRVPKLAGQGAKYIASALGEYKKGERKHPTMRAIAASLSDQDMADLAAFYSTEAGADEGTHAPVAATGVAADLIKRGNCASCHGENFSKPIDLSYPKLAGQHPDYLYVALKSYQIDHNPRVGRTNPIMMGMARPFTHPELKAISEYLASLPGDLKTVPQSRFR